MPTGLLPVWQERVARTANQPGFYRCDGGVSSKTAPTGLLPVWAGVAGRFGSVFRTPFLDPLGGNHQHKQEKVHKRTSQPGFYRYDGEDAGIQVQAWLVTVYRPAGDAPNVIRGCLERGANRASTGVATIVRRSSSLARAGTGCQPADSILRINRRTLQTELCQPGFYRCGE